MQGCASKPPRGNAAGKLAPWRARPKALKQIRFARVEESEGRDDGRSQSRRQLMDKDRIKGAANEAKGAMKQMAGKVTGDAKLKAEGKAQQSAGKLQNAIGGLKDAARGK